MYFEKVEVGGLLGARIEFEFPSFKHPPFRAAWLALSALRGWENASWAHPTSTSPHALVSLSLSTRGPQQGTMDSFCSEKGDLDLTQTFKFS